MAATVTVKDAKREELVATEYINIILQIICNYKL